MQCITWFILVHGQSQTEIPSQPGRPYRKGEEKANTISALFSLRRITRADSYRSVRRVDGPNYGSKDPNRALQSGSASKRRHGRLGGSIFLAATSRAASNGPKHEYPIGCG